MSVNTLSLREYWLECAVEYLLRYLEEHGYPVPQVRVSCGWPLSGGMGARKQVVGQCFAPQVARDGKAHIFISPVLAESVEVFGTLLHELLHASIGVQHGHKTPFARAAKALGLSGPPTQTTVSDTLRLVFEGYISELGPYPHKPLVPVKKKKKGSRLRLYECSCKTPVKVRVASNAFQAECLVCGDRFVCSSCEEQDEDSDGD